MTITSTTVDKITLGEISTPQIQQKSLKWLARECPGVSGRGRCWWSPAAGLGALTVAVHAWDLWKEVTITFITSTVVSVQLSCSAVTDSL